MSELETELRELLQRKAEEVRLGPDLPRPVLRRARRRCWLNAAVGGITAAAVVAGLVIGVQALQSQPQTVISPGPTSPEPTTLPPIYRSTPPQVFPGIWPVQSEDDLSREADRVRNGQDQWLLQPDSTALQFAQHVLGWDPSRIHLVDEAPSPGPPQTVAVAMWNEDMTSTFTPDLDTTVALQAMHPSDAPPIWMAVEVRGGFVEVTEPPSEQNVLLAGTPLTVSGTVSRPPAGWIAQAAVQPRGEFPAAGEGSIRQQEDLKDPQFSMDFGDVPIDLAGSVTLAVTVYSGSGHILGMAARVFAVETQTTPSPTGGNGVTPIAAIWPELNAEDLAAEQARVDAGQDPWRLVAFQTAMHFAESVMGWDPAEIEGVDETGAAPGGLQTFSLRNRVIAKEAGPAVITTVAVTVQHLGRQGPTGIYSVTEAETNPSFMDVKCPSSQQDSVEVAPGLSQEVCGDLAWTPLGSKLQGLFLNGDVGTPNLEPDEATNGSGDIAVAAHFDGSIAFTSNYGDQTTGVLLIEMTGQDGIVDALYARKLTIDHSSTPTASPTS